jgi:hypothetical protein
VDAALLLLLPLRVLHVEGDSVSSSSPSFTMKRRKVIHDSDEEGEQEVATSLTCSSSHSHSPVPAAPPPPGGMKGRKNRAPVKRAVVSPVREDQLKAQLDEDEVVIISDEEEEEKKEDVMESESATSPVAGRRKGKRLKKVSELTEREKTAERLRQLHAESEAQDAVLEEEEQQIRAAVIAAKKQTKREQAKRSPTDRRLESNAARFATMLRGMGV